jgi:hypothetical protein
VHIWAPFFSVAPFPYLTTNQRPPVVTHPLWNQEEGRALVERGLGRRMIRWKLLEGHESNPEA